ncbi:YbaN family protein [Peptoniphilus sp. KCTC 25270]|uniref:YbaN family protein n=1 Tax=Peptoniphilus sp. KCTC 25270 TaxID=2897414 RepID=UPI001E3D49BE|nr:YbaN family protein [Peptoniphilus sp. KCTC 25270]MCD1146532.1 YbaN family protein [Peptoniphilus sp. KCTC 25270]
MKKYILFGAGCLSLVLGTIGLFFPLLPTTPFLLFSAFCFLRSSDKAYHWLMNHKYFGEYLRNYEKKQITASHRRKTLTLLYVGIGVSLFFIENIKIQLLLIGIAIGVTWHLMSLKGV